MKLSGILWDYDGTIIDTARKNMKVTIEVLKHYDKDIESHLPLVLQSYENYQIANHKYKNWQEFYMNEFNVKESDLSEIVKYWAPEQAKIDYIPDMFDGLKDVINSLEVKMGICSQNSSETIKSVLKHYDVLDKFQYIVGYDETGINYQKPDPAGFIKCVSELEINNEDGFYIYIGDHSDDVTFARNAEKELNKKVISITVDYLGLNKDKYICWKNIPDYYVTSVEELNDVLKKFI